MPIEKQYKVTVSTGAVEDIADITIYIYLNFGKERATRFSLDIKRKIDNMGGIEARLKTDIYFYKYLVYKKLYPPSIIFYIIDEHEKEIQILRVLRH